jgi:hypothetical protein
MKTQSALGVSFVSVLVCGLSAAACGGGGGGKKDAGSDAGQDSGADVGVGADLGGDTSPDAGVDTGSTSDAGPDMGGMDGGGPEVAPPAVLTATLLDRRQTSVQLNWGAPGGDGGTVAGYQIRYAKVAITTANFDDTTVTTAVTYTGPIGAPGTLQSFTVQNLYIENSYFFAVAATDAGGNHIWMQATTAAVIAHFATITLTGTTGLSNEGAGISLDGTGDANGDGKSDLFVGSANGSHAYLFFGNAGTLPTTPSVVFSGSSTSFGGGVAYIGDVDHDGREDLAISARSANEIFIFKGRASWPLTLTDTNADYVVTADATYANSSFGTVMARLGDFNGDGVDDFAVGAPNFGGSPTFKGRVTIILGAASFGANLALPSTTRAIVIDADPALATPFLGTRVLGLGHFYPGTGTTLVTSAPGVTSSTIVSNNEGHIYAFRGQAGTGGAIAATAADAVVAGAMAGMRIGAVLGNLGPVVGSLPSVGSGNPNDATTPGGVGSLFVFSGTTTTGPFAANKTIYLSGTGSSLVGAGLVDGSVQGRDTPLSLIGGSTPDLVVLGRNGTDFAIIDGSKVAALPSPVDARTVADVIMPYPAGFSMLLIGGSTVIPDVNGDGHPDFAFSNAASNNAGQVVVLW